MRRWWLLSLLGSAKAGAPRVWTVFCAECTNNFDYKSIGVFYSHRLSGMPGGVTRLVRLVPPTHSHLRTHACDPRPPHSRARPPSRAPTPSRPRPPTRNHRAATATAPQPRAPVPRAARVLRGPAREVQGAEPGQHVRAPELRSHRPRPPRARWRDPCADRLARLRLVSVIQQTRIRAISYQTGNRAISYLPGRTRNPLVPPPYTPRVSIPRLSATWPRKGVITSFRWGGGGRVGVG